jgi:hypothetical protein
LRLRRFQVNGADIFRLGRVGRSVAVTQWRALQRRPAAPLGTAGLMLSGLPVYGWLLPWLIGQRVPQRTHSYWPPLTVFTQPGRPLLLHGTTAVTAAP